jgi:hypothetical protein
MVDAVQVFPPGFRVTDANDNPVNNAKINFRDAGPGAPKTVYSDAALTVPLGTTVRTRADGQPVMSEGSSTVTQIYVGADPYWVEITDADDAIIVPAQDNVKGAAVLTPAAVVIPPIPVITTGSPLTLDATHKGKLIDATNTTITLGSAVTLGDGWHAWVRNGGVSNQCTLIAASGVSFEGQSFTARGLFPGEGMHITCNGTSFQALNHLPPRLRPQGPGVVLITDRVSSTPGSPTPGFRYLVTADFGGFVTGQIIEYKGSGFNVYTPHNDSGWIAYVQDEDRYYAYKGTTWVDILNVIRSTDLPAGTIIDRAYAEYTANADLTTNIPLDDTIPQNTEGTEIVTASITPKKSANRVRVTFTGQFATPDTSGPQYAIAALFQDNIANALRATYCEIEHVGDSADAPHLLTMIFEHSPGTTSAVTYKIRVGGKDNTVRMNGAAAGRLFGGVSAAVLTLEEIQT